MPPKKGLATTKKLQKHIDAVTDDEESSPPQSTAKSNRHVKGSNPSRKTSTPRKHPLRVDRAFADVERDTADPTILRGIPKLSNPDQPCQDLESLSSNQTPQSQLVDNLFPRHEAGLGHPQHVTALVKTFDPSLISVHRADSPFDKCGSDSLPRRNAQTEQQTPTPAQASQSTTDIKPLSSDTSTSSHGICIPSDPPIYEPTATMANMIPGGAFVPPNQQRNLRACMVCSIVRTYTQFMNGGCPNCEEFLELANNSEMVNDCTSQVFEGLITVADTSKSWVARYQRLEGYVPGVYATQVEGILPEELVSSIEAAGINYIPRDGSEDQMIPKD